MDQRIQLALNVSNLGEAISFYSRLFDAEPHKVRDGYANFAITQPPLKLVLIENPDAADGSLNHLGVEVAAAADVAAAVRRLQDSGLATDVRESELCCHAVQDKVWVTAPGGAAWEIYTVLDDAPEERPVTPGAAALPQAPAACCTTGAGAC